MHAITPPSFRPKTWKHDRTPSSRIHVQYPTRDRSLLLVLTLASTYFLASFFLLSLSSRSSISVNGLFPRHVPRQTILVLAFCLYLRRPLAKMLRMIDSRSTFPSDTADGDTTVSAVALWFIDASFPCHRSSNPNCSAKAAHWSHAAAFPPIVRVGIEEELNSIFEGKRIDPANKRSVK